MDARDFSESSWHTSLRASTCTCHIVNRKTEINSCGRKTLWTQKVSQVQQDRQKYFLLATNCAREKNFHTTLTANNTLRTAYRDEREFRLDSKMSFK